jgi:hypothetical protein
MTTKLISTAALSLLLMGGGFAEAGQRSRGGGGTSGSVGRAVPRATAPVGRPGVSVRPAYPSYYGSRYGYPYYGYRYGYPYGYYPYGLGFGFGYPYGYAAFGYPYGYPYGAYPYGGYGYVGAGYGGGAYGGVRITDAPKDAAVYADGYYVGTVDDFDGTFQRLNLEAGAHHVEIVPPGQQPIAFDVNVHPGQTITYRAN